MNSITYILIAVGLLALIILSPIFTIWALNTVFPALAIPFTIWTWLAVIWLHTVAVGISYKNSK
jgi:hypothetical protein